MFKNKIMKKITALALSCVFMLTAFSGCSSNGTFATINGVELKEPLLKYLVNTQKISVTLNLEQQGASATQDITDEYLGMKPSGDQTLGEQYDQRIVNQAVYFELLNQLFDKEGLKIDEAKQKEIDEKLKKDIDETYNGDKYFDDYLKLTRGSRDIYKMFIVADVKEKMMFDHYYGEGGTSEISDEEFKNNTGLMQHILYKTTVGDTTEEVSDASKEEQEQKANKALSDLKSGRKTIEELMKTESDDTGSASNPEGYFVFKGQGTMVEEFEKGSLELGYGEYGVVKSKFGYHVIKHNPLPFNDKDKMAEYIAQYKADDFNQIITAFKDKCTVTYNDKILKKYGIQKYKATSVTKIKEFFTDMNEAVEKKKNQASGESSSEEKPSDDSTSDDK